MIFTMRRVRARATMTSHLMAALQAYIHGDLELMKSRMNEAAVWYDKWIRGDR